MRKILLIIGVLVSSIAIGQPRIDNIDRAIAHPLTAIQITGVGFSADPADLQVWFGSVQGSIISSTESSITVTVPASARLSSVEVINLENNRSAKSPKKFMPNFSGETFVNTFSGTSFSNADDIFDLCSCDFDGDGKSDIAGSKFKTGKINIMLLRNTSTIVGNTSSINFVQSSLALPSATYSVACGDINGDGKPDLIASRTGSTGNTVFVFQNTSTPGTISFATRVDLNLTAGDFARELSIRDLNRDGQPEIIVTNSASNTIYVFENNLASTTITAGGFTRIDKVIFDIPTNEGTLSMETADMNNDGWPDIVVAPNQNANEIYILKNPANGSLTFTEIFKPSLEGAGGIPVGTLQNINDIAVADFDQDANGLLDIVVADRGSAGGKAFVFVNKGSFIFESVNTTGFVAPLAFGVDVADMNGDGFADFVIGNRKFSAPEEVNIFINNKAATPGFAKSTITTAKANWFVKAQDFDGDSKPDIAVTSTNNATNFSIDIWKNRNCHQAVILNEDPFTVCNPQVLPLEAAPLQALTFSWSNGDNGPTTNVDISDAGLLTITAVGEGGTCTSNASITVVNGGGSVPATPTITAPTGVCAGNPLTVTSSTTADEYEWSGPDGFTSSAQNPSAIPNVTIDNSGLYRLRVKTGGCYSDFAETQIDVVSPTAFSISGTTNVCVGQSFSLTVNEVSGYNYQWKNGSGTNIPGETESTFPKVARNAVAGDDGNYTVFISHQSIACTDETDAYTLNVLTAPVASFTKSPAIICVGTEVTFNASGSTVDNTAPTPVYTWNFGDTNVGTGSTEQHTYASQQTNIAASLTLTYTGVSGCSSNSSSAPFNVNAAIAPVIDVNPLVTEICPNGTETVTLSVTGTFNSFDWSTGGATSTVDVNVPDTYSVETVDANGCVGNAQVILTDKPGCSTTTPGAPKAFTPNGDSSNDLWVISNVPNIQECSMNVFDGRGRRVYETKSFPVTGWDGVVNGKPLPDGTYYYVLSCPGSKPATGSVLIIR